MRFPRLLALAAFALAAQSQAATLGYIYVGPEKDYGYNTSMDLGRQYVAKNLPGTKTVHGKSGKLGFIAAFPIPQVLRSINAFTLGAQAMNPKATTSVVWTGGWLLPAKEAEAANSLIDAGIDVIGEQVDSPMTIAQTAEKRGIHVVGKDVDVSHLAPKAVLTGASWNWGPTMLKLVKEIQAGSWKPSHVRGDMKDGTVVLDKFGPAVPESARKAILARKDEILKDKFVVWSGRLAAQDGKEVLPAAKPMPMEKLESMNFFVKGVQGTIQ